MARIVKREVKKQPKADILSISVDLFVISAMLFLCSSLFLRSYNNTLSAKTQTINNEIAEVQESNNAVQAEIRELASNDRVTTLTDGSGLAYNQNNITTISGESAADGE